MLTTDRIEMLKRLAQRALTNIDFKTVGDLKTVQGLVNLGYARDFGDQFGRRIPIRLRIWGITDSGRAVLEQQSLAENKKSQLSLAMLKKPSLTIKPCVSVKTHKTKNKKTAEVIEITTNKDKEEKKVT
jgi:hypothetical protein